MTHWDTTQKNAVTKNKKSNSNGTSNMYNFCSSLKRKSNKNRFSPIVIIPPKIMFVNNTLWSVFSILESLTNHHNLDIYFSNDLIYDIEINPSQAIIS